MEILEYTYKQALKQNEEMIDKWKRCISEYMCVKERLETFRNELSLKIMVPLGSKALMRGKLYHTNEILVHLGDGWFTKRSAHQALEICDRRIKNAEAVLQEFEKERSWLISKTDIPKKFDVFCDKDRKEIIEDYDEHSEKEWRIKHADNVKLYNQELARRRELDKHDKNEDEYWQRLEELEIQEELENELYKMDDTKYISNNPTTMKKFQYEENNLNQQGVTIAEECSYNKVQEWSSNPKHSNDCTNDHSVDIANIEMSNNIPTPNSQNDVLVNSSFKEQGENNGSFKHQADEISKVVLLERKSNACENLPIKMKLSYDFIGAFDDNIANEIKSSDTSLVVDDDNMTCKGNIDCVTNYNIHDIHLKTCHNENSEISNVKLLNRESNINENMKVNIKFGENPLGAVSTYDNNSENNLNKYEHNTCPEKSTVDINIKVDNDKSKHELLEDYKKKLLDIRKEIESTSIKSHDELCKQLDNYDLKEELEHKITLLQDELNIANDVIDSDSSDDSTDKTTSMQSEKSLKRVSFTEKDHTKYLDDDAPDPPLILHFKHSSNVPHIVEPKDQNHIESPQDLYRIYKNCFIQNDKPYKSILKKTTSNLKNNEVPYEKEPGFGDSTKTQIMKKKVLLNNRSVVIGDVSENKARVATSETTIKDSAAIKGPVSRFKSMRQTLK